MDYLKGISFLKEQVKPLSKKKKRLTNELNKYSSYVQVVQTPEAKYQTWLGGSLLSTRLDEIWFSKENYDEKGPKGIHEVCTPQYFAKLFN